jgi:hypothetical protein
MPVRGFLLFLVGCVVFGSAKAEAQARNPHAAVAAPQMTNPIPQTAPLRRPGIPPNAGVPTQVGPTGLNGKVPAGPAVQVQPTPAGQVQPSAQPVEASQQPLQMPPKSPRVTYVNGQLTVVAENSMMTDVLNGVRSATGIKMEGLGGNADRVYGQFGPAPPRVVINSLLNGSHYDFIILSSVETPDAVQRVILSPRGTNPNAMAVNNPGRPTNRPPVDEDNDVVNNQDEITDEQPVPAMPTPGIQQQGQPMQQGQQMQQGQAVPVNPSTVQSQGQQPGGTPQGVKTPEQLLEELRRLNSNQRQNAGEGPRPPQQPPDIVPR